MPTTLVVPHHIGFILDGNRRFAKLKGLKPWRGHDFGRDKVHELLDWCEEFGVRELTLYTFSIQNFQRPAREVEKLMSLIKASFEEMMNDKRVLERKIKVRAIGQLDLLPDDVQESIRLAEHATKDHDQFILNICVAYGGKEEIFEAVKKIAKQVAKKVISVADISLERFESNLFLKSRPDLIIRTGGEFRTSNFLPWQSGYSEWFFIDKLLPEFSRDDLAKIIQEFGRRERRFGR